MKILILHSPYRWSGGEETTVNRQADMLRSYGHSVSHQLIPNPRSPGLSIRAMSASAWNPVQFHRAREMIDAFRPDVVHVHNTWFSQSPSVITAAKTKGVPLVTTLQNYRLICPEAHLFRDGRPCTDCVGKFPVPGIRHRCYRGSAVLTAAVATTTQLNIKLGTWSDIDVVHVPSEFARDLLTQGPIRSEQTVVFPNAVPDPGPRPAPASSSRSVVFVGRLSPEKGLEHVLAAWEKAEPNGLTLKVIGDGPSAERLRSLSVPNVEFLGALRPAEVARQMLSARTLLFPSRWYEVCPMVIVEALSCGLPVFGANLGATPELIRPISPDLLIDPLDDNAWASALELVSDDGLIDRIGSSARDLYEQRHTIDRWHASHLEMYELAMRVK